MEENRDKYDLEDDEEEEAEKAAAAAELAASGFIKAPEGLQFIWEHLDVEAHTII